MNISIHKVALVKKLCSMQIFPLQGTTVDKCAPWGGGPLYEKPVLDAHCAVVTNAAISQNPGPDSQVNWFDRKTVGSIFF